MNLIIGLLILVCLAGSEFVTPLPVDEVWPRLLSVLAIVAMVPGIACFQTAAVIRKIRSEPISYEGKQNLCRRMTLSHALVWLASSLAIIWAIRWQDVVRGAWALDQWPLIDETLILFPIVVSLVVSWMVFFELQAAINDEAESKHQESNTRFSMKSWIALNFKRLRSNIGARKEFVSVRFRLYFLLVLIPVGLIALIRDLGSLLAKSGVALELSNPVALGLGLLATAVFVACFPFLILLVWKTSRLEDQGLEQHLLGICKNQKLAVSKIRIWRTGNQIVNAVVIGLVPRIRMILLSDGLLDQFDDDEIEAIVRHEAGHIRLWHLPTRMLFMLLPLLALAIADPEFLNLAENNSFYAIGWAYGLVLASYGLYLHLVMRWLSHQMEHEADMYAIQADRESSNQNLCGERADKMTNALLRLAAIAPAQYDRNSLFHPSIRRRICFIDNVLESQSAESFSTSFERRRRILGGIVATACIVLILVN